MKPDISIRIAIPEPYGHDMAAITRIRTSVRENHLSVAEMAAWGITPESVADLLRSTGQAWIARLDGTDAGFVIADAANATVFGMFVHPDCEGRGLGRRLMAEAEAWLFARGCTELWLSTDIDRKVRAHGFYRRLGWIESGFDAHGESRYIKRRA